MELRKVYFHFFYGGKPNRTSLCSKGVLEGSLRRESRSGSAWKSVAWLAPSTMCFVVSSFILVLLLPCLVITRFMPQLRAFLCGLIWEFLSQVIFFKESWIVLLFVPLSCSSVSKPVIVLRVIISLDQWLLGWSKSSEIVDLQRFQYILEIGGSILHHLSSDEQYCSSLEQ